MRETTYTPGPWRIGDAGITIFGPPNGNPSPRTVARIQQHPRFHKGLETNEDKANAHLIAAAPELLQALLEASRALTELDPLAKQHNAELIDSAIAKARGQS